LAEVEGVLLEFAHVVGVVGDVEEVVLYWLW
jgi:hypothetical protein